MEIESQYNGIGFVGPLTLIFVTLKLIGKINWSWWWVLSPLWITALIWLLIALAIAVAVAYWEKW